MADLKALKENHSILSVLGRFVDISKKGRTYTAKCPFHDDSTASLVVYPNRDRFKCFGCQTAGDIVDFVQKYKSVDMAGAVQIIEGSSIDSTPGKFDKVKIDKKEVEDDSIFLSPACPPPSTIRHPEYGTPAAVWAYKNTSGELLFYICRWNNPDGSKRAVMPFTPWLKAGRKRFLFKGIPNPRPLYGLDKLRPEVTVGIHEGEKAADAGSSLFPHIDNVTWQGGAGAVNNADWSSIYGKNVLIFPDNDEAGQRAAMEIYKALSDHCPVIKVVRPMPEKKWDWADFEGSSDQAIEYAKQNIIEVSEFKPEYKEETKVEEPPAEVIPAKLQKKDQDPPKIRVINDQPYRALGFENQEHRLMYWFFSNRTQSILCYPTAAISKDDVIKEIAPANFWEGQYSRGNGRVNALAIAERLREECASAGYFNASKVRGRGAWVDGDRIIIHAGDRILADGKNYRISEFKTDFAYQFKQPLSIKKMNPLGPDQSSKLLEVMSLFNWERKISATLLAGWCVIAPFSGILPWRSHIWVIGGAATGKSWVLQKVVRPILGDFHFAVQSKTTEPAIRQMTEGDALALVFDEFEAENENDAFRVQSVIELARSSSSSDGGQIVKGSAKGKSANYQIRSCFCFASIAQTGLGQYSDLGRITTFSLGTSTPEEKLKNSKIVYETITPEFCDALILRTISLLPVLVENIKTFSMAAAAVLKDTRAGDQVGPMIAGAYLLKRSDKVSLADAIAWIEARDWSEEKPNPTAKDEFRIVQAILEKGIRIDGKVSLERTIGELIFIAGGQADALVTPDQAVDRLLRIGINPKPDGVFISMTSREMRSTVLRGTQWATNYGKIISRIDGARIEDGVKFAPGIMTKAVFIPNNIIKP